MYQFNAIFNFKQNCKMELNLFYYHKPAQFFVVVVIELGVADIELLSVKKVFSFIEKLISVNEILSVKAEVISVKSKLLSVKVEKLSVKAELTSDKLN